MTAPRDVIRISSFLGDWPASGLGPDTAIQGTAAAHTNGVASTTITLTNSPDLSGVQVGDLIKLETTAGVRKFSVISAVDDSAKTVTVDDSFNIASGSAVDYGIGGYILSLSGTGAGGRCLVDNNGAAGDAKPGWIIELQAGHSETGLSSAIDIRCAGDQTTGRIIIRGIEDAFVRPRFTYTGTSFFFILRAPYIELDNFDVECSGNSSSVYAFYNFQGTYSYLRRLRAMKTTNGNGTAFRLQSNNTLTEYCYAYDDGAGSWGTAFYTNTEQTISNCMAEGTSSSAFSSPTTVPAIFQECIAYGCSIGFDSGSSSRQTQLHRCIADNCTDGFYFSQAGGSTPGYLVANNIAINCTTNYNFVHGDWTTGDEWWFKTWFRNNCAYNGSSYNYKIGGAEATSFVAQGGNIVANPFVITTSSAARLAALDWSIGGIGKHAGYPQTNIAFTNTRSYTDIGPQRQEPIQGTKVLSL